MDDDAEFYRWYGPWASPAPAQVAALLAGGTLRDGISYQRPEITLLLKAWMDRPKDRADLAAAVPLLAPDRLDWLRTTLEQVYPGHAWRELLS